MMTVVIDNKNHTTSELSDIFDQVDVGNNLDVDSKPDYGMTEPEKLRPFEDKVKDLKAIIEPEEVIKVSESKVKIESTSPESEPEVVPDIPIVRAVEDGDCVKVKAIQEARSAKIENPLGLDSVNFKAYQAIQKKHPRFQLYDGSQAFLSYYTFKVKALKSLLTNFPLLNIKDMDKEVSSINIRHQVEGDLPDPRVIGMKMSECQQCRGRVTALLMRALVQLPAWKKYTEILNSKLWKDHDMKGAHKREGLAAEHNLDMIDYYTALQGFVDSTSQLDAFLKATHDSLSRQLSCVITTDKVGIAEGEISPMESAVVSSLAVQPVEQQNNSPDSTLDGLDTIESGTLIPKIRKGGLVERDFAGAEIDSDFLESVG